MVATGPCQDQVILSSTMKQDGAFEMDFIQAKHSDDSTEASTESESESDYLDGSCHSCQYDSDSCTNCPLSTRRETQSIDVDTAKNGQAPPLTTRRRYQWFLVFLGISWSLWYATIVWDRRSIEMSNQETIYVPGAGFSGFWFTLGRLHSIRDPLSKDFYCFSAGCLGVVASLRNFTVDEMLDVAEDIQGKWKNGQMHRHEIVEEFVGVLVNKPSSTLSSLVTIEEAGILSRLKVITSTKSKWLGLKTRIRTPQTIEELREMLVQTTWIPFAVGGSLWHTDSTTGEDHMDGAFTMPFHPKTFHFLGLPLSFDILSNVVNVNIARAKVRAFWEAGFKHGL